MALAHARLDEGSHIVAKLKSHGQSAGGPDPAQDLKLYGKGVGRSVVEHPVSHGPEPFTMACRWRSFPSKAAPCPQGFLRDGRLASVADGLEV